MTYRSGFERRRPIEELETDLRRAEHKAARLMAAGKDATNTLARAARIRARLRRHLWPRPEQPGQLTFF